MFIEKYKSQLSANDIKELNWHYWVVFVFLIMAVTYILLYALLPDQQGVEFLSVLFIDIVFIVMFIRLATRPSDYYFYFDSGIVENEISKGNVRLYSREAQMLINIMEEGAYLDTDLTVVKLAEKLKIPSYKLSQTIKSYFKTSFFDFINSYRIKKAIEWFNDPKKDTVKVDYIAQECGFKNRSSFFNAFKKITGTTPANYRNELKIKSFVDSSAKTGT